MRIFPTGTNRKKEVYMAAKERARGSGNCPRANVHAKTDANIVAQEERAYRMLAVAFGITFALMCAWTIIAGV